MKRKDLESIQRCIEIAMIESCAVLKDGDSDLFKELSEAMESLSNFINKIEDLERRITRLEGDRRR